MLFECNLKNKSALVHLSLAINRTWSPNNLRKLTKKKMFSTLFLHLFRNTWQKYDRNRYNNNKKNFFELNQLFSIENIWAELKVKFEKVTYSVWHITYYFFLCFWMTATWKYFKRLFSIIENQETNIFLCMYNVNT